MSSLKASEVRVRFAPSPTGYLHIGGARTAVFNYLFARKHGGKFLLRIEDTDLARSGQDMVQAILDGLTWLGLSWDEPPVYQSSRFPIYRARAAELVEKGRAYRCYCTREELERERQEARQRGEGYRYSGRCRHLTAEQRAAYEREGRKPVIRFAVEPGVTRFYDHVHGEVEINNAQLDDFVLLRSDGVPTYHLAVVVDDHEMGITHVIRGDDHLSNTPKQVLLYEAFGWPKPEFAHVPLILGPDRKRLSKRHGATSVGEYASKGYLPEAVVNFIALLGWSPGDDREIMTLDEMIQAFDLSGISKASAIFDEAKLEWMNGVYISSYDLAKLAEKALPFFAREFGWDEEEAKRQRPYVEKVVGLLKLRVKKLGDFPVVGRYFFTDPDGFEAEGVRKHFVDADVPQWLELLAAELERCEPFEAGVIERTLRDLAQRLGIKAAQLIHPSRLAVTGRTGGPGLFELFAVLGKGVVVRRLRRAAELVRSGAVPEAELAQ
jgi:glutamyl-tRNA synthetase